MTLTRSIRLLGATGQLRTAKFQEQDHLVVPVVALVEGVVWPVNGQFPELVLASEFEKTPAGWNGRPVVMDHPKVNGDHVSANDPTVLEHWSFGQLFNTKIKDSKLTTEAWLNLAKAKTLGPDAERLVEKLQNGETNEISVGTFMTLEMTKGVYKGKKYEAIWRNIVPDHLAMLSEGSTGACSVEMGCGALRAASAYLITEQGYVPVYEPEPITVHVEVDGKKVAEATVPTVATEKPMPVTAPEPVQPKGLLDRIQAFLSFRDARSREDLTFRDIERALDKVLRDTEPGFLGVGDVAPGDKSVVYATMDSDYKIHHFRRGYKLASDGEATLADDRTAVEMVSRWEALTAEDPKEPKTELATACGCKPKGEVVMNKTERIAALVAKGKITAEDAKGLETVSENVLKALEAETPAPTPAPTTTPAPTPAPTPEPTPAPAPTPAPTTLSAKVPTVDEYIAAAPAALQSHLRAAMKQADDRKAATITALKATNRCNFTDAQLAAMDQDVLDQLSVLAAVPPPVTFEGRQIPTALANGEVVAPPPSLIKSVQDTKNRN